MGTDFPFGLEQVWKQCEGEGNVRIGFPTLLYLEGKFKFEEFVLTSWRDSRAPGAFLAPRMGMERTMIKVDKDLAREAIVLHDLLTCWQ